MMTSLMILMFLFVPQADLGQAGFYFEDGNQLYQDGNYEQAISQYRSVIGLGYESASLYYNLGNAYFKLNDIGHAILYYEKAKKLAPRDADILHNLKIARVYVVDKIQVPNPGFIIKQWHRLITFFNTHQLSVMMLAFYVFFLLTLIFYLVIRKRQIKSLIKFLVYPSAVAFAVFLLLFLLRLDYDRNHQRGIVLEEKVTVMSAPSEDAKEVFSIHRGLELIIADQSGDYYRIRLVDGKEGWLPSDDVGRI
jgi:tetratricopeptide (TPR) repeat protein